MVTDIIGTDGQKTRVNPGRPGAARLDWQERLDLSVAVLAGQGPVARLAAERQVSRKFLYQQAGKAERALQEAFTPPAASEEVLYHLPISKRWIEQFVVAAALLGHSSYRGIVELAENLFDYHGLSEGTVHNILGQACARARARAAQEELSAVRVGAHDEIYQAGRPVLVGVDARSTYCYLLAEVAHCDETTWGVHLLDLAGKGLHPQYTVADGGLALRAGQRAAWKDVPCHGDVFHGERELSTLASALTRRAAGCAAAVADLAHKKARADWAGRTDRALYFRLGKARRENAQAQQLAQDIRVLNDWLQKDILSLAGPNLATRRELFDFVAEQLRQREPLCRHRIEPVRLLLQRQRDDLLAFAGVLEARFAELAGELRIAPADVQAMCELQQWKQDSALYWRRRGHLLGRLGEKFQAAQAAVQAILEETPRASSVVENLNSRLRSYFFLRRQLGDDYLELLRFFLNHHRFLRSERPERRGQSPAQLLTGQTHAHWLELLGFQRFSRN